jgi:hypothetical protein
MTFDEWWDNDGKYYDPDWDDIPWYDKRKSLAEYAWHRALETRGSPPVDIVTNAGFGPDHAFKRQPRKLVDLDKDLGI